MSTLKNFAALVLAAAFPAAAFPAVNHAIERPTTAPHTWVSNTGQDTGFCLITAPCATFAYAVTKTSAAGELSVLDPGDYGPMTITRAITVDGGGFAQGLAAGSDAYYTISAAAADIVQIRNLTLEGAGQVYGILLTSGAQLHLDHVKIDGFSVCLSVGNGSPATEAKELTVENSSFNKCGNTAISVEGSSSFVTKIVNTQVHHSATGVEVETGTALVSHSVFSGEPTVSVSSFGIVSNNPGVNVMVDDCAMSDFPIGLAAGDSASLRVSRSTISHNQTGLFRQAGGLIISNGDNRLFDNGNNGTFSSTVALQ
jgi:hypothetical protein